jgi:hypothetical protein
MSQRSSRLCVFLVTCLTSAALSRGVASAQVAELLPNLEPFAASDVQLADGGNTLRFSTATWNKGAGPMELVGGEVLTPGSPTDPGTQNVYQQIYRTDGSIRRELVGVFEYHGGTHNHFHLENYARYTLQPVNAPGGSNRTGAKVSFCLLDNTKINTHLPNAAKRAVYTTCNPDIQGISVGWGDTYRYYLDGQSFDFTGNPSGDYLLKVEGNPNRNLIESDYTDNVSCALVRVDRTVLSATVIGTSCNNGSAVRLTEISPSSVTAGSSVPVVIKGFGFQSGMNVTFENGSGKVPVAGNVVVIDENMITANVSVAVGGSNSDPVWDVRVGSAVLLNSFTVIR